MNGDKNFEGMRIAGKGAWLLWFPFILFAWSPPVNISNTDSASGYPAMAIDKRGWLHVVWEEKVDGSIGAHGINDIYYVCMVGSVWTLPLNVSNDSFASWRPDVAVDTLNRVHVVWGNYETGKIMWTMCEDGVWTTPVSISDSVPYPCVAPRIAVNPLDNTVHCVWHDLGSDTKDADVWHTYFDGEKWSIPENVTHDPSRSIWPDVAVDSLGRIHLVWEDCLSSEHDGAHIYYTRFENGSWLPFEDISPNCEGTVAPRIAIDRDNNPHVVWEERTGVSKIYYTYFDGARWVNPVVVDSSDAMMPDIAMDKENKAYITWVPNNEEIFNVIYIDSIPISAQENVSNTDSFSASPSIVAGSEHVHLVWIDFLEASSGCSEIYYSRRELLGIGERNKEPSFSFPSIAIYKLFFTFSLTKSSFVTLSLYNLAGRKVKEVSLGFKARGTHHCDVPLSLPSGVYFPILKAGTQVFRGKIIFINP